MTRNGGRRGRPTGQKRTRHSGRDFVGYDNKLNEEVTSRGSSNAGVEIRRNGAGLGARSPADRREFFAVQALHPSNTTTSLPLEALGTVKAISLVYQLL